MKSKYLSIISAIFGSVEVAGGVEATQKLLVQQMDKLTTMATDIHYTTYQIVLGAKGKNQIIWAKTQ